MSSNTDLGTKPVKLGKATLPIGFGNFVMVTRIVAVCDPLSAPVKKMRQKAQESQLLIDATKGRRIRAIIVCDSRQIILSAVHFETLQQRLEILNG